VENENFCILKNENNGSVKELNLNRLNLKFNEKYGKYMIYIEKET